MFFWSIVPSILLLHLHSLKWWTTATHVYILVTTCTCIYSRYFSQLTGSKGKVKNRKRTLSEVDNGSKTGTVLITWSITLITWPIILITWLYIAGKSPKLDPSKKISEYFPSKGSVSSSTRLQFSEVNSNCSAHVITQVQNMYLSLSLYLPYYLYGCLSICIVAPSLSLPPSLSLSLSTLLSVVLSLYLYSCPLSLSPSFPLSLSLCLSVYVTVYVE